MNKYSLGLKNKKEKLDTVMKGSNPRTTLRHKQNTNRKWGAVKGVCMPLECTRKVVIDGLEVLGPPGSAWGPLAEFLWLPCFTKNVETLIRPENSNNKARDDETWMLCWKELECFCHREKKPSLLFCTKHGNSVRKMLQGNWQEVPQEGQLEDLRHAEEKLLLES